jgi:hypothetical protein
VQRRWAAGPERRARISGRPGRSGNGDHGAMLVEANRNEAVFRFISRTGALVDSFTSLHEALRDETLRHQAAQQYVIAD